MRLHHPKKDLDTILADAHTQQWNITRGNKYFKLWCPCEGKHKLTVHLSPSNPRYQQNWRGNAKRTTCWKEA